MSELTHKERTLQDIIDEMTPEQRETMDLVVGAAVEDEVIDDDTIVARAEALPLEQRQLIDFLVGSVLDQQESASLEQSNLRVNNFLEHYGVKGMKWGVTKNSDGTVTVNQTKVAKSLRKTDQPVTVSQRKAGTYVKAKGGQRQTASQDAIKTQAARQRAKRSTTDSLSTKELKDTIERMRLEQEFAKLDKKVSRRGQSFVARLLRDPQIQEAGKRALSKAANNAA